MSEASVSISEWKGGGRGRTRKPTLLDRVDQLRQLSRLDWAVRKRERERTRFRELAEELVDEPV